MRAEKGVNLDFSDALGKKALVVNDALRRLVGEQGRVAGDLTEAIKYTLEAPGKRIRAALVLWCCELISGSAGRNAEVSAAAIEMVHTYSLIHDDLPAMDNDDIRRGRPTCHKAFDEATAILTGDALLTLAFEILAKEVDVTEMAVRLVSELAEAAGPAGMIAGQMADLKAERTSSSEELLRYIHTNKTARIFRCAAAMGAICGGADKEQFDRICTYGLKIGLSFQIADDILDISGSSEHLGKTAGKDERAAKCTYPSVVGMEKSRQLATELADEAIAVLAPFGRKADILRRLATALLQRTR